MLSRIFLSLNIALLTFFSASSTSEHIFYSEVISTSVDEIDKNFRNAKKEKGEKSEIKYENNSKTDQNILIDFSSYNHNINNTREEQINLQNQPFIENQRIVLNSYSTMEENNINCNVSNTADISDPQIYLSQNDEKNSSFVHLETDENIDSYDLSEETNNPDKNQHSFIKNLFATKDSVFTCVQSSNSVSTDDLDTDNSLNNFLAPNRDFCYINECFFDYIDMNPIFRSQTFLKDLKFHFPENFSENMQYADFFSTNSEESDSKLSPFLIKTTFYCILNSDFYISNKFDSVAGIYYEHFFDEKNQSHRVAASIIPPIFKETYEKFKMRLIEDNQINFFSDLKNDLQSRYFMHVYGCDFSECDLFNLHGNPSENIYPTVDESYKVSGFLLDQEEINNIKTCCKNIRNLLESFSYFDFCANAWKLKSSQEFINAKKSIENIKIPRDLEKHLDIDMKMIKFIQKKTIETSLRYSDYRDFFLESNLFTEIEKSVYSQMKFSLKSGEIKIFDLENTTLAEKTRFLFDSILKFCKSFPSKYNSGDLSYMTLDCFIDINFDEIRISYSDSICFFAQLERNFDYFSCAIIQMMIPTEDYTTKKILEILNGNGIYLPKEYIDPVFCAKIADPIYIYHPTEIIYIDKSLCKIWTDSTLNYNLYTENELCKIYRNPYTNMPFLREEDDFLCDEELFFCETRNLFSELFSRFYNFIFSN